MSISEIVADAIKSKKILIIVGCTKVKIWDSNPQADQFIPAAKAYKGPLFAQFKLFNDTCSTYYNIPWKILSAKYGIIDPTYTIEHYNISFASKYNDLTNDYVTNDIIKKSLVDFLDNNKNIDTILVWAGAPYCDRIISTVGDRCNILTPAAGLKIGVSLHVMKELRLELENILLSTM